MIRELAFAGFRNARHGVVPCRLFRACVRLFGAAALCAAGLLGAAAAPPDLSSPSYASAGQKNKSIFQGVTEYAVMADKSQIGKITVFANNGGVFVRLGNILPLVGAAVTLDPDTDRVQIAFGNGATITVDPEKRLYTENGQQHDIYDNELAGGDGDAYVNFVLLNRLLPAPLFLVNQAEHKIYITASQCAGADSWCRLASSAPETAAQPTNQSIVIDNANNLRTDGVPAGKSAETRDVVHSENSSNSPSSEAGDAAKAPADGEVATLILQPQIKKMAPSDNFVEALDSAGEIFLPLNDFVQLFGFPVKMDKDQSAARGFLFSSENTFVLDLTKSTVHVGNRQFAIAPREVRKHQDTLYVSIDAIGKWFGIQSDVDRKQQIIHFMTDKLLPQEEQEERNQRWRKLLDKQNAEGKNVPLVENPYRLIGYPVFDVNLNSVFNHAAAPSRSTASGTFNVQGYGDLGFMTGQVYAQGGSVGQFVNALRLSAGRKDPDYGLLGRLHATDFNIGDVTSPSLTLVTANSIGRGFNVTNRSLFASENFDVRSFSGDAVPGYQVELYRNDELLGFQSVDSTGRYNFTDQQILYGENVFRVVLYGPQGQQDERIEAVDASASMVKKGQFEYDLGLDQRGMNLIPVIKERKSPLLPPGLQAVASFRYGVTSNLTAGISAATTMLADGAHYYSSGTLAADFWGIRTETNYVKDFTNNGWAGSMTALTSLKGFSLRGYYQVFGQYISETINRTDTPLSSKAGFDANAQVLLPVLGSFGYGASVSHQTFADAAHHPADTFSLRLAKSLLGVSLTNTLNYTDQSSLLLHDTFALQTRIFRVDLRMTGIYQFKPAAELQDANLTANYQLTDRLSGQTQLDKNLTAQGSFTYSQTLYWDFDAFRLGLYGQMDDRGGYTAGFNLTLSVDHNPLTDSWRTQPKPTSDSGSIAGRVYVKQDAGEAESAGKFGDAKIRLNRVQTVASAGDRYFVDHVAPYQRTRVEIDPSSLADPLLSPERRVVEVVTRPGSTVMVDFPLVTTTIIEGNLYILDAQGHKQSVKSGVVELQDKDGHPLRQVITEFDGYFSFDQITAGEYRLGVPAEVLKDNNAVLAGSLPVSVQKVTEFISNKDIVLRPKPPE